MRYGIANNANHTLNFHNLLIIVHCDIKQCNLTLQLYINKILKYNANAVIIKCRWQRTVGVKIQFGVGGREGQFPHLLD